MKRSFRKIMETFIKTLIFTVSIFAFFSIVSAVLTIRFPATDAVSNVMPLSGHATSSTLDYVYAIIDGGATITKYTGNDEDVAVPDMLGGYPVTAIGNEAFQFCRSPVNVNIPEGVTKIGKQAFYSCKNL